MEITLRLENQDDYRETENLTREAFWDVYQPGCNEHLILNKIRGAKAFVGELDFVACDGGRIVGNIIYSKAKVVDRDNRDHELLCLGPVCVLPEYQRKGIGSRLIRHTISLATALGYPGIVLAGNPDYYGRFGFTAAEARGITNEHGKLVDYLLALELCPGGMEGMAGRFCYDEAFYTRDEELNEFEKEFPPKEKHVISTQLKM